VIMQSRPTSPGYLGRHTDLEASYEKLSMEHRTMELQLEQAETKSAEMLQLWKSAQAETR